ncbi:MAG: metallophosphoesterase [Deltaproteobacteria bacterium]|nr:metallophosphoesterase [Deltaproteobacteria bacterium]
MPRLLFATDFHGNTRAYDALFELAQEHEPDAVILGGDLCPYPRSGIEPLVQQGEFVEQWLGPRLEQLAASCAVPVFAIPGNDDCAGLEEVFEGLERTSNWRWLCRRSMAVGQWHIAGLPYVPVTPFFMSDYDRIDEPGWEPLRWPETCLLSDGGQTRRVDASEIRGRPTLAEELEQLAHAAPVERTIFVVHTPPWSTKLDIMHDGQPVGSRALRRFIEQRQPPLTLHGHIHESPYRSGSVVDRIDATWSFNPGTSLMKLQALWITLDDDGVAFEVAG